MSNGADSDASSEEPARWLQATAEDFSAVDLNTPPATSSSVDTRELSGTLNQFVKTLEGLQRAPEERVYRMLGAVCSFHFKPTDREEPFGPMMQFDARRTAIPGDFKGAPASILASNMERIENPAVRARVADMVWLLDRKQATAAWMAIDSYVEIVKSVRDGSKSFLSGTGVHGFEIANHLRRGIQIARAVGWEKEKAKAIRNLVSELHADAAHAKKGGSFRRLARLDLDYRLSDATVIAKEAETLAEANADLHVQHDLLHVAARAHRMAQNQAECDRNLLRAAECLVAVSAGHGGSAMFESHWLERAISEMHRVPGTKDRRQELKHRLVDAQARIIDELTSFSHGDDISEIVQSSREAVSGKPLVSAIRSLSELSHPPTPAEITAEARRIIAENPLSSMFAMTQYDSQGKPVYRDQGMEGGDDSAAVQRHILQSEKIRRSVVAQGGIEPARLVIVDEHYVGEDVIGIICSRSPFVPQDRRAIFTSGILHFFHGDMIAALHTLVPQLEDSLRHVLRLHGHDVTRLNDDDMTQEDLGLSALLDKLRPELNAIFNERMVTEIDNLFNHRGGPNLRNRLAHGLVGDWEPHSHDAIYACWLIFQLCCIPLHSEWDEIASLIEWSQGPGPRA